MGALCGWREEPEVGKEDFAPMGFSKSQFSRRDLLRRAAVGGAVASIPFLAAACDDEEGGGGSGDAAASVGNFPETPDYNFVFVNHVTTNPFFVPTIYGLQDAAALLGIPEPQWTGSEESDVQEMVDAMTTAISGDADGIAVAVVDTEAFTGPIQDALDAGIPVVSYNADGTGLGSTRVSPMSVRTCMGPASRWESESLKR